MPQLQLKYVPPPKTCYHCHDELLWTIRYGYVHSDGRAYSTYVNAEGEEVDDHAVRPVDPGRENRPRRGRRPGEKEKPDGD